MTALQHAVRCYRWDQRTFWRMPQGAFFTIALPLLMLTILATLNDEPLDETGGSYVRYLLVGLVAFSLTSAAYGNLAARLVHRRETGVYQRLRTTPVPAAALVAGQVASALTIGLVTLVGLFVTGALFFDVAMPDDWLLFAVVVVLGATCCCALGAAVSTAVGRVESAEPVVFATMIPIAFISGVFDYVPSGSTLARIADLFPVRHIVLATMDAFGLPGTGSIGIHLLVITAWGAAGALVAVRRFRWAPTR